MNKRAARADAIDELQHARACGAVAAHAHPSAAEEGVLAGALAAADAFADAAAVHAKACTALLEAASRNEACDRLQGRLSQADTATASTRDAARRDGLGRTWTLPSKRRRGALNHAVAMLKAAREGSDVADARRAVADAIAAAAELREKARRCVWMVGGGARTRRGGMPRNFHNMRKTRVPRRRGPSTSTRRRRSRAATRRSRSNRIHGTSPPRKR